MEKKFIVVGVSGGIAAFKACQLVSDLSKKYDVQVIMTKNACNFVNPITFETLTKKKCLVDTFDRNFEFKVEHISVAKACDVFVVVPATANVIAKFANGIADDMLSTTMLACNKPRIICPAMNVNMYENPATQKNLETLKNYGYKIVEPGVGYLACGDEAKGRLADLEDIKEAISIALCKDKPLIGKKVVVSAGPTIEAIDPVRYITNHSSGKMGYELAKAARNMGADVVLVSGQTNLRSPYGINTIRITSAEDMYQEITNNQDADIIIKAAAVADYTPIEVASQKVKKSDNDMSIPLKRTKDILKYLGENKRSNQVTCGFAMETRNLEEYGQEKLIKKNADMIVCNNVLVEGAGFKGDTNVITMITKEGIKHSIKDTKENLSYIILNELIEILKTKEGQ